MAYLKEDKYVFFERNRKYKKFNRATRKKNREPNQLGCDDLIW